MHVGLIGAGRIGSFHASLLAGLPAVDRLTLADADAERAERVARDVGATAVATSEAVIEAGVEALVIAAATPAHAPLIHVGADAGLPTFCEKPIALDLATTDAVVDHVDRAGILLQIGFQRRFDAGYRRAREARESGALGRLYLVRLGTHDPEPPHESYIPESGGIFRDLHIHDFDIARWVVGQEVDEVYADGGVLADEMFARHGDIDTSAAVLRFADGTLGILSGARHDPLGYDIRMELFGSGDSVVVGVDDRTPLRSTEPGVPAPPGPAYRNFIDRFDDAYRRELEAFVALARDGGESPCDAHEARRALCISLAADRSLAERRPVRVAEVS